jgi:hypothetical protein
MVTDGLDSDFHRSDDFLRVHQHITTSKLHDKIDIAETLSNLRGKWVKRIRPDSVVFEDREEIDINNLGYRMIKPLIWW